MSAQSLVWREQPQAQMLIRDVHVFDPRERIDVRLDVRVCDGEIAELSDAGSLTAESEGERVEVIDGSSAWLLPAFFDPHVHLRTPGQEHKEDLETGTRAAAAGGFCGVIAMPNTDPVIDSPSLLRSLRDAASSEARVPVGFMAAITRGLAGRELSEMAELTKEGALGFTDDGLPVASAGMLRKALQYQRLCGGVLALHEEDPSLSAGGSMREGPVSTALGLTGIPSVSESTMVARDAELALYEQGRVHFQHLSAKASVEAVSAAKQRGAKVSCEASPHHLLLTEAELSSLDTRMKMNPPLGDEQDRLALLDGLRSGVIDCVATDHAPHAREEKELPFEQAPMGTTGLETAFAALYTMLVKRGMLDLGTLVERMTAGAGLFGLAVSRIAVGQRANLALLDLNASWVPGEHGWESRSDNCCFAGRRLDGRVLMTIANGVIAYRQRSFTVVA
jgi:dihydroorotase